MVGGSAFACGCRFGLNLPPLSCFRTISSGIVDRLQVLEAIRPFLQGQAGFFDIPASFDIPVSFDILGLERLEIRREGKSVGRPRYTIGGEIHVPLFIV